MCRMTVNICLYKKFKNSTTTTFLIIIIAIFEIEVAYMNIDNATAERIVMFNNAMAAKSPLRLKSMLLSYNIRTPGTKS